MESQEILGQSNGVETVAAFFQMRSEVSSAINELNAANFSNDDIGVVWHDPSTADWSTYSERERELPELTFTRVARIAEGTLAGTVLGAAAGLLSSGA